MDGRGGLSGGAGSKGGDDGGHEGGVSGGSTGGRLGVGGFGGAVGGCGGAIVVVVVGTHDCLHAVLFCLPLSSAMQLPSAPHEYICCWQFDLQFACDLLPNAMSTEHVPLSRSQK